MQHQFQNYSIQQCVTQEEIFIKESLTIIHFILIVKKQPMNWCYATTQSPLHNDNIHGVIVQFFCELSWEVRFFTVSNSLTSVKTLREL